MNCIIFHRPIEIKQAVYLINFELFFGFNLSLSVRVVFCFGFTGPCDRVAA